MPRLGLETTEKLKLMGEKLANSLILQQRLAKFYSPATLPYTKLDLNYTQSNTSTDLFQNLHRVLSICSYLKVR
jgi:hypothetical protein